MKVKCESCGNITEYVIREGDWLLIPSKCPQCGKSDRFVLTDSENQKPRVLESTICPWCEERILPGEPTGIVDGQRMHINCAAEEMDNVYD